MKLIDIGPGAEAMFDNKEHFTAFVESHKAKGCTVETLSYIQKGTGKVAKLEVLVCTEG